MFAGVSHPYTLQVAALWISFIPAFAIVVLLAGAQLERARRRSGLPRVDSSSASERFSFRIL
jgi:hypothetical protein